MPVPTGRKSLTRCNDTQSSVVSPSSGADGGGDHTSSSSRRSFHRLMEKLTPKKSGRDLGNGSAMQNSCPVGSTTLVDAKRSPRSSLGRDLRRSFNQLFQHSVTKPADHMRASSEHQLNSYKVETLRIDPNTGIQEARRTSYGGEQGLMCSADNLNGDKFSSEVLAKLTKPLTGSYLSDNNVFSEDLLLHSDGGEQPSSEVNGSARSTPSYLRISCALNGYRRNLGPRCSSTLSTVSTSPSPQRNRLLCMTNVYNNPASPEPSRPNAERPSAQTTSVTPMDWKEIVVGGLEKLSLRDNSPVLRLLASCQEQRRKSVEHQLASSRKSSMDTGESSDINALVYDNGIDDDNNESMKTAKVGPVHIVPNSELLPILRNAEYYKELAAFERYRLECLCGRMEKPDGDELSWPNAADKAALADKARTIVDDLLKPFEQQLEDKIPIDLESSWQAVAAEIDQMDQLMDEASELTDDSIIWSEKHGELVPLEPVQRQAEFYQKMAANKRARLEEMCRDAEVDLQNCTCEEACDRIRSAIGKANLLLKKKFKKFEELLQKHLEPVEGEPCVKLDDLEGFWSLVEIEMADIDSCFESVRQMKANNWTVALSELPKPVEQPKPPMAKAVPKKRWLSKMREARQRVIDAKLLAKQRMQANKKDAQDQSNGNQGQLSSKPDGIGTLLFNDL